MRVYDALYAFCRASALMQADPALKEKGFMERTRLLKDALRASPPFGRR
jgi:hypothetical protein